MTTISRASDGTLLYAAVLVDREGVTLRRAYSTRAVRRIVLPTLSLGTTHVVRDTSDLAFRNESVFTERIFVKTKWVRENAYIFKEEAR